MRLSVVSILFCILAAGCANIAVYEPVRAGETQTLLLNESGLKSVQDGMSQDEVHALLGQTIVIGYRGGEHSAGYEPLTIPNPYKTEKIALKGAEYTVEYYVSAVRQPDGVISDNELEPVIFKNGKTAGKGWGALNGLRPRP